jgi:large conductance mechanosensitive channel
MVLPRFVGCDPHEAIIVVTNWAISWAGRAGKAQKKGRKTMKLINDFKAFLMRGNVVDLAIAVVIGAAFGAVVSALVSDLVTPLIAAIFGKPDFSNLFFTANNSIFKYGHFINAVIAFILIAAVVFFLIIVPLNKLIARSRKAPPADPTTRKCPECLSEIPVDARRCSHCTTVVGPATPTAKAP